MFINRNLSPSFFYDAMIRQGIDARNKRGAVSVSHISHHRCGDNIKNITVLKPATPDGGHDALHKYIASR